MPDSVCRAHPAVADEVNLAYSYEIQIETQDQISGTVRPWGSMSPIPLNDQQFVLPVSEWITDKIGSMTVNRIRNQLTICDVEPCRVVGQYYPVISVTQQLTTGQQLVCQGRLSDATYLFDDYNGDGSHDVVQVTRWTCQITDAQSQVLLGQNGPDIETVCLWNGWYFGISSSEVVTPSQVLTRTLNGFPQMAEIERTVMTLTDCSGDRP